jgi:hypothetical protein
MLVTGTLSVDTSTDVKPPPGPNSTLRERLAHVIEARGYPNNHLWSLNAGLGKGTVGLLLQGKRGKGFRKETAQALGEAANVSWLWLLDGTGPWEPYHLNPHEGAPSAEPAASPPSPPAKVVSVHAFPPVIDQWFQRAFRIAGRPDYTGEQILAAKVYVRDLQAKLPDHPDMEGFCAAALEAAYALDAKGQLGDPSDPTTPHRIAAWLATPIAKIASRPGPIGAKLDALLRQAQDDLDNDPDWSPAGGRPTPAPSPEDTTPQAKPSKK